MPYNNRHTIKTVKQPIKRNANQVTRTSTTPSVPPSITKQSVASAVRALEPTATSAARSSNPIAFGMFMLGAGGGWTGAARKGATPGGRLVAAGAGALVLGGLGLLIESQLK